MLMATGVEATGAPPRETPRDPAQLIGNDQDENDKIEVTVKNGYVYVYTSHAVAVQLYSILGQLITQHQAQPGTTRVKAPAKGVYILKVGTVTRRVTVN